MKNEKRTFHFKNRGSNQSSNTNSESEGLYFSEPEIRELKQKEAKKKAKNNNKKVPVNNKPQKQSNNTTKEKVKQNSQQNELKSYINRYESKMINEIKDFGDDSDLPPNQTHVIENKMMDFVKRLRKAQTLNEARLIVRQFYNYLENIEEHPLYVENDVKKSRSDAIQEINGVLNDCLDETINPLKRMKAKEIAKRYINQIHSCSDIYDIDEIVVDAITALFGTKY